MIKKYTEEEFNNGKSDYLLTFECERCHCDFKKTKGRVKYGLKNRATYSFCSVSCYKNSVGKTKVNCTNCGIEFEKLPSQIKRSVNNYCSNSCNASYCNKNKTHGNRRSKLEKWLEEQLTLLYPNLPIDFNKKGVIGSELDIYVPSLNLAFELNGIFHYEPIYGINKLTQIQSNDVSKSLACHDAKIDLCIIDTSQQKYVKPSTSQKFLDIIISIIEKRLLI